MSDQVETSTIYTTALFLTFAIMGPIGGRISDHLARVYERKLGLRIVPIVGLPLSAILLYIGTSTNGTVQAGALMSVALGLASRSEAAFWTSAIDVGDKHVGGRRHLKHRWKYWRLPCLGCHTLHRFACRLVVGASHGSLVLLVGVITWFFVDPTKTLAA
jgi:hypothetical protein